MSSFIRASKYRHVYVEPPKVDQTYGYRMRVVITPFTTREAILQRYKAWAANL